MKFQLFIVAVLGFMALFNTGCTYHVMPTVQGQYEGDYLCGKWYYGWDTTLLEFALVYLGEDIYTVEFISDSSFLFIKPDGSSPVTSYLTEDLMFYSGAGPKPDVAGKFIPPNGIEYYSQPGLGPEYTLYEGVKIE